MIHDESEPSIFHNFEEHLYFSSDEDKPTNLERKSSVSLFNISSTPYLKQVKKCRFREAESSSKPKRKKYDHVESKVKKYRMAIQEQTRLSQKLRHEQEQEMRKELENNMKEASILSPIINQSVAEEVELIEKYEKALEDIEILKSEISSLKSTTPGLIRKRSQTTMFKDLLTRNSSTTKLLENNTTVLIGNDTTCCTNDIDDCLSPVIKSPIPSPIDSITNSAAPLLFDFETKPRKIKRTCSFFKQYIKCPAINFIEHFKRRNKVGPIPRVQILSPGGAKIFDESYVFLRYSKQDLLAKEMMDCCTELTEKMEHFKRLYNEFLITNNNNNNT